jgi:hypothetical protein
MHDMQAALDRSVVIVVVVAAVVTRVKATSIYRPRVLPKRVLNPSYRTASSSQPSRVCLRHRRSKKAWCSKRHVDPQVRV